jgi:hypothetical protein
MTEHTPLPWEVRPYVAGGWQIHAKQGPVTVCPAIAHGEADASFIVKACNMHAELVNALDDLLDSAELRGRRTARIDFATSVLAKAREAMP